MKKTLIFAVALLAALALYYGVMRSRVHAPIEPSVPVIALPQAYASSTGGVSLRLPAGYGIDGAYGHQLVPGKSQGIKLALPEEYFTDTNLSRDTHMSLEWVKTSDCRADYFIATNRFLVLSLADAGVLYSFASTSDAGAGNRYDESLYALKNGDMCIAIRYFIHSTVFENYEPGTIKRFDKDALMAEFDAIRRSVVLSSPSMH